MAGELGQDWELKDMGVRQRLLIAVSKFGHCLIDLIHLVEWHG